MFKRLLLILVVGTVLLAACAKPPVAELEDARRIVAHAYASGASRLAADAYLSAQQALSSAEEQMRQGKNRQAKLSLQLARNFSSKALSLTVQRKQEYELEQRRLAEEKRLAEELQQAELLRKQKAEQAKRLASKEKEVPPPVVRVPPKPELILVDQVVVVGGEDLAVIAARPEVYKDAMLWPLIYKANRDQIKDPKQIFPGQILLIPRDKNQEEVAAARQEAEELKLF